MSSKLLQESYADLQQLRRTASDAATQQARLHASQLIEQRTALLFEQVQAEEPSTIPAEAPEGTPEGDAPETPNPEVPQPDSPEGTPELTPETPAPEGELSVGDQPSEESWEDLIQKLLATEPTGEQPSSPADMTSSEPQDLTSATDAELIREFLEADPDVKIDIMQDPEAETPVADKPRSFADVLKETLGDDLEQGGEGDAPIEAPAGEAEGAPSEDADLGAELNALGDGSADTGLEAPTANAQELADAIASLGAGAEEAPAEVPAQPEALNEAYHQQVKAQFEVLNEGVMKLAAKNKNQERELQQLREQNEALQAELKSKDALFTNMKTHLYESVVLTTKTALANQLLMENTTTREGKMLIMETLGAATTREEATLAYNTLTEKIQKNTLLKEGFHANQQVGRVFTAETGLLKESAIAKSPEQTNPMVERWARNANYTPVK